MEENKGHELEDYEPGATKEEVFNALKTVAKSTVKTKQAQNSSQPDQASS